MDERCAYKHCNAPIKQNDHWESPDGRKFCSDWCREDESIRARVEKEDEK